MRFAPASTASCMRSGRRVDLQQHALHAHLAEDDGAVEDRLVEEGRDQRDEEGDRRLGTLLGLVQVDRLDGEVVRLEVAVDPEVLACSP